MRSNKRMQLSAPKGRDPTAFCKWRTACPVYMLEKEHRRNER